MKYSQAERGRTFVIRLEHREVLHEELERFARNKSIKAGMLIVIGGADRESKLIVGPEDRDKYPVSPVEYILKDAHEISGTGTIFPDKEGNPIAHIHIAAGRKESTKTGCIRQGVKVWEVMEIILIELKNTKARRLSEAKTGFKLLNPDC